MTSHVEKQLRYLCSSDAERLSDYVRINYFVSVGNEAANLLSEQAAELRQFRSAEAGRLGYPGTLGSSAAGTCGGQQ